MRGVSIGLILFEQSILNLDVLNSPLTADRLRDILAFLGPMSESLIGASWY